MSKAYSDLILQDAIEYLNKARVCIEAAAREKAKSLPADCMDLQDAADDLGPILLTLESFTPPKPEPVEKMFEIVLAQPARLIASVQVKAENGAEAGRKALKIADEQTLNWEVDWDMIEYGAATLICDPDECEIG